METENDYNDTSGYNPLFLAAHNGEINLLDSLLKNYSAIETIQGRTLINVAAARGHEVIVRLLTKRDADDNTPLHIAIKEKHSSVFHLLVKECNVNAKNYRDETPLHYAAAYNCVEFAKILIEHGASFNERDPETKTPLYYALKLQNVQLAEILFKSGAVLTDLDYLRWDPLCSAVEGGNLEMVKLLMSNGWNTIDTSNYCISPLRSAVTWGKLKVLEYLLKNGSKSNKTITEDSLDLFGTCIKQGRMNILKFLIDTGLKTNNNLLMDSIFWRQHKIWEYLLTCRSKIISDTYFNETKLHWAVRTGQLETVKIIVNQQEITVKSDSLACKLAVYIAVESSNEDILQVLLKAGYSTERCLDEIGPLHLAATYEHTRLVEMLLAGGADVNSETTDGLTPLHFAAITGRSTVVKFLLQSGADSSKFYEKHMSPLLFAVNMFSSRVKRSPVTTLAFTDLVKIAKMLILQEKKKNENIETLLSYAVEIKVYNDEHKQNTLILNSKGQTDDSDDNDDVDDDDDDDSDELTLRENEEMMEFRPEILRCIFNHLEDNKIKHHLQSLFYEGWISYSSSELLHVLMEYDDSKSCSVFLLDSYDLNVDYKCQVLLIDYSRNFDDLVKFKFERHSFSSNNIEEEEVRKVVLLKLIIARLVLLTNSRDLKHLKLLEFCTKHELLDWHKECEMQKVGMQKTQIADIFKMTFHDILSEPVDKVANYARNETFREIMESSCEQFPAYTDFLKLRIEKGIRRKELREECTNLMFDMIKKNYKIQFLNDDLDQIFEYLSVVDLRRLSEAFS